MSDPSTDDLPLPGKGKKARKGKKSRARTAPAEAAGAAAGEATEDVTAETGAFAPVEEPDATRTSDATKGSDAAEESDAAKSDAPPADVAAPADVPSAATPADGDAPHEGARTTRTAAAREETGDDDHPLDDGPAEPPVIGCTRCDARVVMGSRYCPSCGVPLVRSGEQAATALSRTRRRAPVLVRLVVPLLLLGVLGAIWYVATLDPLEQEQDSLTSQLTRVVDDHRQLSDRLVELEDQSDPAEALGAARSALATVQGVQDDTEGVESGRTGRTTRVRRAMEDDRAYLAAVVSVLANPRSKVLSDLGARSARAVAALRSVDDIVDTKDAIRGTRTLALSVRARRESGGSTGTTPQPSTTASGASRATKSPFVNAVDKAITQGAAIRPRLSRGFALLRAARDGVDSWDGTGEKPESPSAALTAATAEFEAIAASRTASAERARAVPTRQDNQAAITGKLAAAYTAGAATANRIGSCVGSFQNSGPEAIARQCLQIVREPSAAEVTAVGSFSEAFLPAREAAGLTGPVPKL